MNLFSKSGRRADRDEAQDAMVRARHAHAMARAARDRLHKMVGESGVVAEELRQQRTADVFDRLLNQALGG